VVYCLTCNGLVLLSVVAASTLVARRSGPAPSLGEFPVIGAARVLRSWLP